MDRIRGMPGFMLHWQATVSLQLLILLLNKLHKIKHNFFIFQHKMQLRQDLFSKYSRIVRISIVNKN